MSDTEDTFNRAFARFEEIQAQYRADRERLIVDDETRQRELAELQEEHHRLDEETLAKVSAEKDEDEKPEALDGWNTLPKQESEFSFGFEDEPSTESIPLVAVREEQPVSIPKPTEPNIRTGTADSDDDFFGNADWLNK